ncbi:MAG: DUF2383 domain-containing protein [Myxococcales bacterium]|nr:DUF2383 domain-containing protein [Myxococcales bacterium]
MARNVAHLLLEPSLAKPEMSIMSNEKHIGATQIGASGGGGGGSVVKKIEDDQAHALNHLLHLANDLCLAYGTARRRISDPALLETMGELDTSHDRYRIELAECVTALGHTPAEKGDLHGMLERGRVVLGELHGDEGVLRAMAKNEEEMASAFREALHAHLLPAEAIAIIERALAHEETHAEFYNRALGRFVG